MKKYVMLFAFTLAIMVWVMTVPIVSTMSIPEVSGVKAKIETIKSIVNCTGTLVASRQQIVDYGISIKPDNISVSIGEHIETGQKLMDIDKIATVEAFKTLSQTSNGANTTSSDYSQIINSDNSDISNGDIGSLLSQYYNSASSADTDGQDNASITSSNDSDSNELPEEDIPDSVYSNITGVVTQLNVTEGMFAQPTSPLIVITDMNSIQLKAQVDEGLIQQIKIGQNVTINGSAFTKVFNGKVTQIYPSAYSILNTTGKKTVVDVVISIENADSTLIPGTDTDVEINTAQNDNSITLPYEAVQEDASNKLYVYICKDGRALRKNITLGQENVNSVEIVKGLDVGDIVITNPQNVIKNGMVVKLKSIGG